MPTNSKNQIIKVVVLVVILIAGGFLVYYNFIKPEDTSYLMPGDSNLKSEESEFGFDFFEDEVFKSLIKTEQIELPNANKLGRENPFLKF